MPIIGVAEKKQTIMDLYSTPDLWSYIAGFSSPFDTNAGLNLQAAQATAPVITNNSNGTSSVSPSWLSQLTGTLSSLGQTAAQVLPGVSSLLGNSSTTGTTTPSTAAAAGSLFSNPLTWVVLLIIGGLLVLLLRRR
jgi:hypothetical protein